MSDLQRYSYDLVPVGYDWARIEICTDDEGEWVKASDAEDALKEKDARIKELEEQIEKMKCCNNCKHDQQEDHDPDWGCEGCHEGYTKWEPQQ